jgi:hypothetical protein
VRKRIREDCRSEDFIYGVRLGQIYQLTTMTSQTDSVVARRAAILSYNKYQRFVLKRDIYYTNMKKTKHQIYMKKWRLAHPNYMKEWFKANPKKYEYHLALVKRNYSLIKRDAKRYRELLKYKKLKMRERKAAGLI